MECYNPETDSWSPVTEMSARRSGAGNHSTMELQWCLLLSIEKKLTNHYFVSGVGVLDGILYAVGGHDGPLVRKSVESYNPDSKAWTPVADMALCRRNAGV